MAISITSASLILVGATICAKTLETSEMSSVQLHAINIECGSGVFQGNKAGMYSMPLN